MMPDDFGLDLEDERFGMDVETEVVDRLAKIEALLMQHTQLLQVIAQRLGPKRIAKDAQGNIIGVEPVQGA